MYLKTERQRHNNGCLSKLWCLLAVVGIIMVFALLCGPVPWAYAAEPQSNTATIAGSVMLPDGEKAGVGGMSLTITALPRELEGGPPSDKGGASYQTPVTIPEGKNSVDYLINVFMPPEGFGFIVNYTINDKSYIRYRGTGFYSDLFHGQTVQFPVATALDVKIWDRSGINLIITKFRTISGEIVLPQGKTAPAGGLNVKLTVLYGKEINIEQISGDDYRSVDCVIPEGKSMTNFAINDNEPNERYFGWYEEIGNMTVQGNRLMYRLDNPGYKQYGFFSPQGTVESYNDAEKINVTEGDRTGIVFTLLAAADEEGTPGIDPTTDTSPVNEVSFKDVAANDWYNEAVSYMAAKGIISGVGEGRFAPDNNVTRADFLIMVMNLYDIEVDMTITDNFADAGSKYYTRYLGTAKRLGLISGVGGNKYTPEATISRQDMFVLLYRALDKLGKLPAGTSGKSLGSFNDTEDIAAYARDAVKLFVETGTISGDRKNLTPKATSTRAQAAQVLYNLLSK